MGFFANAAQWLEDNYYSWRTKDIVTRAWKQDDGSLIDWGVPAFVKIGKPAVPYLMNSLDEKNDFVNIRIIETLGRIGDPRAMPFLMELLESEKNSFRYGAATAIGNIGNRKAVSVLMGLMDAEYNMKTTAMEALTRIGDEEGIAVVIAALKDENSSIRHLAAELLQQAEKVDLDRVRRALRESWELERWKGKKTAQQMIDEKKELRQVTLRYLRIADSARRRKAPIKITAPGRTAYASLRW